MKISKQFDARGYVIVKKLFTQAELEQITGLVAPIYQQWLKENSEVLSEHQLIVSAQYFGVDHYGVDSLTIIIAYN